MINKPTVCSMNPWFNPDDFGWRPSWVNEPFTSCENLFPQWKTARIMLTKFCNGATGWEVEIAPWDKSSLVMGLIFPSARNALSGELVPMIESFPPEDRPRVQEIIDRLMADYAPPLTDLLGRKMMPELVHVIKDRIQSREHQIIQYGGLPALKEVKVRLGLVPRWEVA